MNRPEPRRLLPVLHQARRVLSQRVRRGATMSSPQAVKDYLRLKIGVLEHEVFCVLFLNAQHPIIELKQMFRGAVTQTSVYPREVVKAALGCNAAAVLLAHNHPSGAAEPSRADEFLTQTLKTALALVDVRVPMQRRCEPSRRCFIGLGVMRVRLGTEWVATATHAATVWALRAVRQQYGNEAGPESKKVSRR